MAYVVIGLGRTGLASVRFLKNHGHAVIVADTREKPPNLKIFEQKFPKVELHVGALPADKMLVADAIIAPPGLERTHPVFESARLKNIPIWGDIELFSQHNHAPVIGITGANGKSTVTSLVGAMFKRAQVSALVGGNIGVPALDLLESKQQPEYFVLELSSFQLEITYSLKLKVAAFLNISRDHLDRHGSMDNYIQIKQGIFKHAQTAVFNRHDKHTTPQYPVANHITFGLDEPEPGHFGIRSHQGEPWLAYGDECLLPTASIKLFGQHNVLNALSALAIGHAVGLDRTAMLAELEAFTDLRHRCQVISEKDGVTWINDTKGTNVGATKAALESVAKMIPGKIILIAGGKAKDTDFSELEDLVSAHVKTILLIGKDGPVVGKALSNCAECVECGEMANAVKLAKQIAQAGDAVLLSPACTSLDAYANFEERGDAFIELVSELNS